MMKKLMTATAAVGLMAGAAVVGLDTVSNFITPAVEAADHHGASKKLDAVLAAQSDEVKARYDQRHPKETLEFFGVKPGMTVVEGLPGSWYGNILLSYLGEEGTYVGVQYSDAHLEVWRGDRRTPSEEWAKEFKERANGWREAGDAKVEAFAFGGVPESMKGKIDVVFLPRVMHHLSRFNDRGEHQTKAIKDMYDMLKPGGIVGVVQHSGPETASDEWAVGNNGYLKPSNVIADFAAQGFELVAASDVNANPLDKPGTDDFVWRLRPALATSRDNSELREELAKIGESNRMTLKFRKPE